MPMYFDIREQRQKPIPDCGKVGCVWDERTQRCERVGSMLEGMTGPIRRGMGFISSDYGDGGGDGYSELDAFDLSSLDFGSLDFGSSDGGFDPNWALDFLGAFNVTPDPNQESDPYWSAYFAAISNGLPPDVADLIASGALDPQIAEKLDSESCFERWSEGCAYPSNTATYPYDPNLVPSPNFGANDPIPPPPGQSLPALPGYCPGGTYHPVTDPFACIPFPSTNQPAARKKAQQQAAKQQQAAQKKQQQMQQPCPQGQARYPYTGKCVPLQCPQGTRRNPATGECLKTANTGALPNCPKNYVYDLKANQCIVPGSNPGASDLWWALLIAGVTLFVAMRR